MTLFQENSYRISICVINFNGELYLNETLKSIYAQKSKFDEVLLIDNASQDNSINIVRNEYPSVKIINLNENLGPAAARNTGLNSATCDYILFIDNDVSLAPECPDRLIEELNKNHRAAIAMPCILYEKNKDTVQYDGADSHFLGMMSLHNQNIPKYQLENGTKKITSLISACFVVDRNKFGNVLPFDDSFFIYFEDHDFGIRAQIFGHEILAVPSARAYHREGTKGLSLRQSGRYSKRRVFFNIRNRWLTILKNYQIKTLVLLAPIFFLYEIFQIFGVIKKGWLAQWLKAFFWILFHIDEILRKRRIVQKNRKIMDSKILKGGNVPFTRELGHSKIERISIKALNYFTKGYWAIINSYL